jgi:hypothetical protein
MNIQYLRNYCQEKISQNRHLQSEIVDLYDLAMSEIEEGGSEAHEVSLAINSIDELIEKGGEDV